MHAPVRAEPRSWLGRLVREPLVHFLLIGAMLFVFYDAVRGGGGEREVRIDDNVAASLYAQFSKTWQRPPTDREMDALVDSYVRDEIFYREGVALGLDKDDPTIKRRVAQKYSTIAEESEASGPPSDNQLQRWMLDHAARYAQPALITFEQIAFSGTKEGAFALEAARKALASGAEPEALGDDRMLLPRYDLYPLDLIERDFGSAFAKSLPELRRASWEGPVKSGYGIHLVRVTEIVPGRTPRLADVRPAVARDYEQDRRSRSLDAAYRQLRDNYRIEYSGSWKTARSK
ncbi:peptidyl-prolyl cis-trans isomerase [Sphingomonas sp. HDW15A]|uniref:peptidylprolyl isomerase n=1 Tax=Sphingomonas sp. HDW15A TaxID=2714942 RepID=UPI001408CA68|nr:peptidylprolyl isomerase [Sphingomonas sp. HDW15A]QIK95921.1 peptidyl-prolyl cis-trans isomerase [Sphingomonas sp. HDW15A]